MKSIECKKCGKIVEGYNKRHAEFLMLQHGLKHRKEEKVEIKTAKEMLEDEEK